MRSLPLTVQGNVPWFAADEVSGISIYSLHCLIYFTDLLPILVERCARSDGDQFMIDFFPTQTSSNGFTRTVHADTKHCKCLLRNKLPDHGADVLQAGNICTGVWLLRNTDKKGR